MFEVVGSRLSRWSVAIGIYGVVSLIALASLLLTPGTVGHHWDWLIPSDPAELQRFASTQGLSWQDYDFGSYVTYRYATILTSFLFGLPGYAGLSGAFVSKSLVLLSVFVSGIGMRFLLLSLGSDDERDGIVATFGGLLYALTPYAYNQIVAGDQSALIADALSPIAIALAVRSVCARDRLWLAYALGSALFLAVIVASAQVFVFTIGVMWAVALALRWSVRALARLALLSAAAFALCSFWILPALLAGGAVHTVVQTSPIETAFATLAQFSNPFLTSTMLAFPGYFYVHALGWGAPFFYLAYGALVGLCAVALFQRRSALLVVLGVLFLLTTIVPLGGNPLLGPVILAVFRALLPYSLFLRTPQHMMFVMTLVVPMMVYLSARVIPRKYFARSLAAGGVIVLAYGQGFFLHSDFFGLIGPFRESGGERATVASAQTPDNQEYRTLFVPNSPDYYYHPGIFDYYFEGSDDPQIRFLPGMSMGAGVKWTPYDRTQQLLKALDEFVPDGADAQTQTMLLQMVGVKHLVVHSIGTPTAGVRLALGNDRPSLELALARAGIATREGSFDDRSIWRFDRPVPRTYAPDCVFGVAPRADPYDVLALASAAKPCLRPAAFVEPNPANRSEIVVPAATFRASSAGGLATDLTQSNIDIESENSDRGFFAVVPPGVQDVVMLKLPPMPARAEGIAFRMFSSAPRRVYVQLYSPDFNNFYQTNVDFSGHVLDVALNFRDFGRVGNPELRRLQYLRFASINPELRDVGTYFGGLHWLVRPRATVTTPYLSTSPNRWDKFYFGGDRERVLFPPSAGNAPAYATVRIERDGWYDVVARVQDETRGLSLRASVGGRRGACSTSATHTDETERLVRLMRLPLRAGPHTVELRYCGTPPAQDAEMGVQSLIVAAARLAPAARKSGGDVLVLDRSAGSVRLSAPDNFLVFSDSYDDRWTATQGNLVLQHVVANGYANGWLVPNPNAGDVVLRFWPQRSFELGIVVSLVLAFLAVAVIVALVTAAWVRSGMRSPVAMEPGSQG